MKDKRAMEEGRVSVWGARVHNLKNIDVEIPRGKLTVITGMSGSGKSSLAFDTIFAEGQRRYVETFSAYARNFLGNMERPDVDKITGLSPVISIEQKTTNKNPRSTVGTTTEIYDFFRLLFARAGEAYSYESGEKMVKYTEEQVLGLILERYEGRRIYLLAPLVKNRKGHYKELFEQIRKKGYLNVRVADERRLKESLKVAMKQGDGLVLVLDADTQEIRHYSRRLMDPVTGLSYSEPAPHNFSFNSPYGACPKCKGLGQVNLLDMDKIVPDPSLSIYAGGIVALGKYKNSLIFWQIDAICEKHGVTLKTPIRDIPAEAMDEIMNDLGSFQTILLLISAIMIIISIIITTMISKHITSPLRRLEIEMKKVETGDFEVSPPHSHSLEVESLSSSFRIMVARIKVLMKRIKATEEIKRQRELDALQAKINPHFLYNTLEAIRSEALIGGLGSVAEMSESLAKFFRYTISNTENFVTVADEIRNVRDYMRIQQYRFGERISLKLLIPDDDESLKAEIPKLILQPIVENAIIHGLEEKKEGGWIEISSRTSDSVIEISVKDNGVGIEPDALLEINRSLSQFSSDKSGKHGGIAISNVNNRLHLLFGSDAGLAYYSVRGIGTTAVIRIPRRPDV